MVRIISHIAPSREASQIWFVGVSFVLFQFFLQLSTGVVLDTIMHDMQLSALAIGTLSSAFYYMYTSLQIPVGLLFDNYQTKYLLVSNAILCALGCFIFAASHHFYGLFLGRLLMGLGSAFAFVGLSHLLREYFPLKQFAYVIGLSETLGFFATVIVMIGMGFLISYTGWRSFMYAAGFSGLAIALLCWIKIPKRTRETDYKNCFFKKFISVLSHPLAWINGAFIGLSFTVIIVFGALWSVPFIQIKLQCSLFQASFVSSMIFLGAAFSCPLFGKLAIILPRRKPLMYGSCLSTALLMLIILFIPMSLSLCSFLLFLTGLCCGAYMLAFSVANELAPQDSLSTYTGFTNTLAMITAPLLQPFIGFIHDILITKGQFSSLVSYQIALLVIPLSLLIAGVLVWFLPEKKS